MTAVPAAPVIKPELFDFVLEYAEELVKGRAKATDPIRGTDKLSLFLENFLSQFSAGYLGKRIQGLNAKSRSEMVERRRKLEGSVGTEQAQALMFKLEEGLTLIPESSYGSSDADRNALRSEYFPELLKRIVAWLWGYGGADDDLRQKAEEAAQAYSQAVQA